jgi:hypothetical protein
MKRLISMSLWGDDPLYTEGALANIRLAPAIYPGWTMRIYADNAALARLADVIAMPPNLVVDEIVGVGGDEACPLELDLVRKLSPRHQADGMFWRFEAVSDPDAQFVIVRDADSRLNVREAAAVEAWIKSRRSVHVMRDHAHHAPWPILGGMWGIRGGVIKTIQAHIAAWDGGFRRLDDQHFLFRLLGTLMATGDCIQHVRDGVDRCFGLAEPFPPHPPFDGFVGQVVTPDGVGVCP